MEPENLIYLYGGLLFFLAGAALAFVRPMEFLPLKKLKGYLYLLPSLGSLCMAAFGLSLASLSAPAEIFRFPISSLFEFQFRGDALSGVFVLFISVLSFAVSIYSIGYTEKLKNMGLLYNLFILSMYGVVMSGNVITFLIMWETMSVVSYFLVTFARDEKSAKAGLIYAVMTHAGTAFIIAAFMLLYKYTGQMDFAGMRAQASNLDGPIKTVVFVFSLIGFGTKAGIIPLHTWLPRAHPAAPSNVSALMSGVMIKTGIYGFIRIVLDIMGGGPQLPIWWGLLVLVIGAASSVLGVLYALMEQDIKRLLAYSSVENVGIILLGLGASMVFSSAGLYGLSAVALTAGLYHTLSHSLFKGLLFLGAGSVVHSTHTMNMEEMGGLIKKMPYTALFFLIGSVSISALPPFTGFVSEWLTFQSLLLGFNSPHTAAKIISPLGGAALALTGALAAAGFVKAFGISFLGQPRSPHAENAKESPKSMLAGMAVLSVLCLLFGIFPGFTVGMLSPAVSALTGEEMKTAGSFIYVQDGGSLSPLYMLVAATAGLFLALFIISFAGGRRKTVIAGSWDCGMSALTPRMQYSATAFTKPLRMIFKKIYRPRRELKVSYAVKPFFVNSIKYSGEITPFFEKYFYNPLVGLVHGTARKVRLLQSGSLHLYLGYMLITLIILLVFGG